MRWPERVERRCLSGTPGLRLEEQPLPDLFRVMQDPARLRGLLLHDPPSAMATLVRDDGTDDDRRAGYQALGVVARLVWERPYDPKLAARLYRIACPMLLLWRADDRLVPPACGEAYRQNIPSAEFRQIARCGYLPMFEREAEFVETVAQFCRQ